MVDEVASEDESSLRQGVGTELLVILIWESSRWQNRDGFEKKDSALRVFDGRGINRRKRGHQGVDPPPKRPSPGRALRTLGQGVAPSSPCLHFPVSSGTLEF